MVTMLPDLPPFAELTRPSPEGNERMYSPSPSGGIPELSYQEYVACGHQHDGQDDAEYEIQTDVQRVVRLTHAHWTHPDGVRCFIRRTRQRDDLLQPAPGQVDQDREAKHGSNSHLGNVEGAGGTNFEWEAHCQTAGDGQVGRQPRTAGCKCVDNGIAVGVVEDDEVHGAVKGSLLASIHEHVRKYADAESHVGDCQSYQSQVG